MSLDDFKKLYDSIGTNQSNNNTTDFKSFYDSIGKPEHAKENAQYADAMKKAYQSNPDSFPQSHADQPMKTPFLDIRQSPLMKVVQDFNQPRISAYHEPAFTVDDVLSGKVDKPELKKEILKSMNKPGGTPRSVADNLIIGFGDKMSLGLLPKLMGEQTMAEDASHTTAGMIGGFAGDVLPGGAAYKGANALVKGSGLLRNAVRGGIAGATYNTAKQGLDMGLDTQRNGDQTWADRAKEFGIDTAMFAGGDAALGALGSGVKALRGFADNTASGLSRNAIKNVSDNTRLPVKSPFVESAAAGNPIARGYTEQVGRSFENSSRSMDNVAAALEQFLPGLPATESKLGFVPKLQKSDLAKAPNIEAGPRKQEKPAAINDIGLLRKQETPTVQQSNLVRSNYKNQVENGNFSPELQQKINSTDQSYDRFTNAESVAKANENVKNLSKAESDFLLNEKGGPDHIATGYRLMQELDALGEHERALVVSKKLAEDLTKSGQTSQAASILSRLSPEGQLLNLVRTAEKNGKTVSIADSIKFKELAAKVQEKSGAGIRSNQFNEILNRLERGENVSVDDIQNLSKFLSGSEKVITPKAKVNDELPSEFKDVKKREKIISFLDDAEQAALARIAARKNNLNSLPLPEWKDHTIVVASQIAKGTIKAATHVEDLVRLFGEEIRPVASQVFQQAQNMIKGVSSHAGEGSLDKANEAFRRLSGQAQAEKAIVQETADHVKKLIADAKAGKLDPAEVQKLRDYSDEIAQMTADSKPGRIPTQEEKFLQSVKALAKKIAQVENEKIPADQANREVSSLLRQVAKIADEGQPKLMKTEPIDNKALSDIAHDVMEKTRPNPKPTTMQEKIVEKYIKDNQNVSQNDIDTLRDLAKNVTRLSGDQRIDADIAMQKILNSYEKSSLWDKTLAIRYMAMLLNTGTQAINAASGPIMATAGHVADVFGTMIDVAMHHTLKTPRTTTLYGTNPLQFMARWLKGVKVGGIAGWEGVNPAGIQSTNEIRGLAFKSLKNPLGLAERTLGVVSKGPDFATYSAVYKSEMEKQGFLDAINSGIQRSDKKAIQAHIENFINDPTEAAMLQADRIGKNTTFQRSDTTGGKVANWLNSSPSIAKPIVNSVFPFVRTPINIATSAVTMTPAGIIKGLFQLTSTSKASQREAIRSMSLGITGTGISAVGLYLYNLGIITGANDSGDKNVDAIKEQAGQGKYRFNQSGLMRYLSAMLNGEGSDAAEKAAKYQEGDHAFDYNKLQPLAFPLAIGAGLGQNKEKPLLGKLTSTGTDAYGSIYGMSTLKGVQDVFQPSYGGSQGEKALGFPTRVAESFFKSFSPGGLAQEARRQDPIVRKTPYNDGIVPDVMGYIESRTPGLSKLLPASKTTLGMDKMNAPGFSGQYANPYKSEVAAYSNAAVLISDLIDRTGDKSLAPSAPDKKVTGKDKSGNQVTVAIPADRYDQLQEEVGHAIIAKIMAIPQDLTDAKKAEKIKQIYSDVNAKERNKVKRELGIRIN